MCSSSKNKRLIQHYKFSRRANIMIAQKYINFYIYAYVIIQKLLRTKFGIHQYIGVHIVRKKRFPYHETSGQDSMPQYQNISSLLATISEHLPKMIFLSMASTNGKRWFHQSTQKFLQD